jgi:hypothetical protein
MRGRTFALLTAGSLTFAASAQAPDPAETAVGRLASPRYAEREKAARELEALGPPALKALKAAQASGDEEVRARAKVITDRIELVERSRRLLAPTTLTLKFTDTPLDQAVAEFAKQTGFRVLYDPAPGADVRRKVTVDTSSLPYWEAVQAFYRAAGLTEKDGTPPTPPANRVGTTPQQRLIRTGLAPRSIAQQTMTWLTEGDTMLPAVRDRAIRVRALPGDFAGNKYDDIKGEVTIHLDVDPAPGLNLQEIVGIEIRRAVAEDGRLLAAAHPELEPAPALDYAFTGRAQLMLIEDGMYQSPVPDKQVPIVLKTAGLRPRALGELSGVLVARVLAPPEPLVTVEKLLDAKGQTAAVDGYSLTVLSVEERPGNRLAVRAKLTTSPVREEMNLQVLIKGQARQFINIVRELEVPSGVKGFEIRTADGKAIAGATTTMVRGTSDGRNNSTEVLLLFPKPDKTADLSLAYTGRRSALVELPFTLKDVPVP